MMMRILLKYIWVLKKFLGIMLRTSHIFIRESDSWHVKVMLRTKHMISKNKSYYNLLEAKLKAELKNGPGLLLSNFIIHMD